MDRIPAFKEREGRQNRRSLWPQAGIETKADGKRKTIAEIYGGEASRKMAQPAGFIQRMIQQEIENDPVRFCMPGHKGALLQEDITETGGVDNLAHPTGALARAQAYAAKAYGAQAAFFSVNGSTAGVIALLLAAAGPGETVLIGGDCHISVSSALILGGQRPELIPTGCTADGMPTGGQQEEILMALDQHPQAKALFLTYPNYYGVGNRIEGILSETRRRGIPLILDGAHGACFGFHPALPPTPALADGCVMSLHKTAMAQNQSAVICLGEGSLLNGERVRRFLNMVQTTSPSWPLLAGSERAIAQLYESGEAEIGRILEEIAWAEEQIQGIEGLRVLSGAQGFVKDRTRLVIDVSGRGITGKEALEALRRKGILCEMADDARLVCICTMADQRSDYQALCDALSRLPKGARGRTAPPKHAFVGIKHVYGCSPRQASYGTIEQCEWERSAGRIAADAVCIYPPGVCVILPGDRITQDQRACIAQAKAQGEEILGLDGNGRIAVVSE